VATVFEELLSGFRTFLAGHDREPACGFFNAIDWRMPAQRVRLRGRIIGLD